MWSKVVLKSGISLAGGMIFWALFVMVFTVYAFMPITTKAFNQLVFLIVSPVLFLGIVNWIMLRLFKEKGWRAWLSNLLIQVVTAAVALGLISWGMKLADMIRQ